MTVHEKPITHFGWTGSEYIVTDNDTGAGAYKISGGSNGRFLDLEAIGAGLVAGLAILAFITSLAPFFLMLVYLLGSLIPLCIEVIALWSSLLYGISGENMVEPGPLRTYLVGLSFGVIGLALGALFVSPIAALILLFVMPIFGIFIAQETVYRKEHYA